MAHRPVGIGTSFGISATSAQSSAISVQTKVLRVVAVGSGAHVVIGNNPTATKGDYYIPVGKAETLALTTGSHQVVGITTGATTIIDFPEGTGSPFQVGDFVTLSVTNQDYYNFTHLPVTSVNSVSSGIDGYRSTRISVGATTTGIATAFSQSTSYAELRRSVKVAAISDAGSGAIYIQQVQISGVA